ncbi:MAG: hypothetical protein KGN16_09580 [Burkholderiales bacterium]|nr:hypothetical protein [Burkholderiales bacterium]
MHHATAEAAAPPPRKAPATKTPRPTVRTAAAKQPAAAAPAPREAKKLPRPRLVRDGFTMPEADFALIAQLKARALEARRAAKKSELLRAGLHALAALDAGALATALDRLDPVRIGRPRKGR